MVLMNELGEQGIDGTLIEDPELKLLEISCGSIFCGCVKNDFIKAMYHIAFDLKPEVVVIEASGVANPSDMDRDLVNPIFKGAFTLQEKFCLIDALYFEEQFNVFTAVEKQIDSSNRFIINKIDLGDSDTIRKIKEVILVRNPLAAFPDNGMIRQKSEQGRAAKRSLQRPP
jgi:G3E family GTPase